MGAPLVGEVEVLSGDLSGRHYAVHEDGFMIGRSSGCDLVLPKRYISRQHARIERDGARRHAGAVADARNAAGGAQLARDALARLLANLEVQLVLGHVWVSRIR